MKKTSLIKLLVTLAVLFAGSPVAHAQGYAWGVLSADDAIQAVRGFEGNPDLAVTVTAMPPDNPGGPDTRFGYTLTAASYEYYVCEYTPDLIQRSDQPFMTNVDQFYGQPYDAATLQARAMSQDAAQGIAQAYMQAHYPSPQLLSAPVVSTGYNGDPAFTASYTFEFEQTLAGGVSGPCECDVTVDTVFGRIVSYMSSYFPVLASTTPTLSSDQALSAAMNSLNISNGIADSVEGLAITKPDALGAEQLYYYRVRFSGVGPADPTGPPETYDVTVDANCGAVMDWDVEMTLSTKARTGASLKLQRQQMARRASARPPALGLVWGGKKTALSYPPLLVGGWPYLWVGYLGYGCPGARVLYHSNKGIEVHGAGREISLSTRSNEWRLNGQTRQSSGRSVMVGGHCYVPIEIFEVALPLEIHYDAVGKQVCFNNRRVAITIK